MYELALQTPELFWEPLNFVDQLPVMGMGMTMVFVLIGVLILSTMMMNSLFSD